MTATEAIPAESELEQRVTTYLWSRSMPSLRKLEVSAERGIITLSGRVDSFYEKQLAISSCQRVAGVLQLVDQVEVA